MPMYSKAERLHTLHPIEIFSAKVNALLRRTAARDLYDFNNMIQNNLFSEQKEMLRKTLIFYASISAVCIRACLETSVIDDLSFNKIRRDLFPVLTRKEAKQGVRLEDYKARAKQYLQRLLVLKREEQKYLEYFALGVYRPELLFCDKEIVMRIEKHPMAIWRCAP